MGGDAIPVIKKRRLSFCFYIIYIGERFENFSLFIVKYFGLKESVSKEKECKDLN